MRSGAVELTYGDLHARANHLAARLRASGVGPDVIVGIHMRRSAEMIIALLAVVKAGGAYLPLDPAYPADRLAFMLTDSGARIVIADPGPVPDGDVEVITVGSATVDSEPEVTAGPHNLAYVIYTSGSTGRPKGVQISHRALVNLLLSMSRRGGPAPR